MKFSLRLLRPSKRFCISLFWGTLQQAHNTIHLYKQCMKIIFFLIDIPNNKGELHML